MGKYSKATRWAGVFSLLAMAAAATTATAQTIPSEQLVTSQRDLIDTEFSQARGRIVWVDNSGSLWTAGVDPDTGLFIPANGKGSLIDSAAMSMADFHLFGNGPEWISTSSGDQIVYTKFLAGMARTRENARLALAQQVKGGSWKFGYLSQLQRAVPYASHDWRDPSPRISYVDPQGRHYWRNLGDASSEERLVNYPPGQYFMAFRFADGMRGGTLPMKVAGVQQVFYHDLDTNTDTQLTFDGGQKDQTSRAWIWNAPEFGTDKALATVADGTDLRIYRETPGQAAWTQVLSIRTPQNGIINSVEHFVYNGSSYLFFVATVPPATYPSQLFLANIDTANPQLLQLTPDLPLRVRVDPEVYIANDGPYIYYNRMTLSNAGNPPYCLKCNEGIFRAYTGLPPQQ
jgi:hypothetical protein